MFREGKQDRRRNVTVLVTDVDTLAGIGVVRSLGRAGYRVIACAADSAALGLRSRYAHDARVHPPYHHPAFIDWLRSICVRDQVHAIVPSEAALLALRPVFDDFRALLPYADSAETVYRALSKCDLLQTLGDRSDAFSKHLPPTLLIEPADLNPPASALAELGTPLFVKADGVYARNGLRSLTKRCDDVASAQRGIVRARGAYDRVLVQGFVPGVGVGAFFVMHRGKVLAEFMHRRIHEVPHTGGVSSLRESWWHAGIRDHALAVLRALDWEGVAMLEYRWDAARDSFTLMELNARFWGSLHLALHAGVDFPRILIDAHCGHPLIDQPPSRLGLRCRHALPKEVQYVWSRRKDPTVSRAARLRDVLEFAKLSLDPRVRSDLLFPGDRRLFAINALRFAGELGRTILQKQVSREQQSAKPAMTA